ncbi:MAG: helix-turn-helix transcriptional regulator [Alphaproteobacteria bacterium]|jgi:transcriptional regulator with XRE-family HTH domain
MATSFRLKIDPKERQVARFFGDVERALQKAFIEAKKERKFTQQQLAVSLGIDRSAINRRLLGRENMTQRSLAEMAWAMGYEIEFKLVRRKTVNEAESNLAAE